MVKVADARSLLEKEQNQTKELQAEKEKLTQSMQKELSSLNTLLEQERGLVTELKEVKEQLKQDIAAKVDFIEKLTNQNMELNDKLTDYIQKVLERSYWINDCSHFLSRLML